MRLWYDKPAQEWLEALPIGNGTIGAMVFGGVNSERLALNHGDLWGGGPHNDANPDALEALPEIRQLVFSGEYAAAQALVNARFMGQPLRQRPYQALGNLLLTVVPPAQGSEIESYERELDLDDAIVRVRYRQGGVDYTREVLASQPDGVIAFRLTASAPMHLRLSMSCPHLAHETRASGRTLLLAGMSDTVTFEARAQVQLEGNGVITAEDGQLIVRGRSVVILLSMATSYVNWHDTSDDPATWNAKALSRAMKKSWERLRLAHLAVYQKLYSRVSLELGPEPALPTSVRVQSFAQGNDPALAALHFQYGRYLLISCSYPGGPPATLQGLWNESLTPPWDSKYTVNINTEMNYWPAAPANLLECYDPLFRMIEEVAESGRRTARTQYGAGGWVCHHNTDGWRGTAPVDGAFWGMWPCGGAWLCKSFWDHYEFTRDKKTLAVHYPTMRGAAEFFLDALVTDPKTGWLVTCPSVSPENAHHPGVSVCAGPAMDSQIIGDLFESVARAAETLKRDPEFVVKVRTARAKLPPLQIGKAGQLQEWLDDWDLEAPEQDHRHVSHLYALFPSNQITRESALLMGAARKSLERRGDMATGWSLAWKLNLWARLGEGERAHALLAGLLTPERTAPNLFDLHPPFQIDGNFGAVSGICEMLLQSHAGELHLLPALPPQWPEGRVSGLRARGGYLVSLAWSGGVLTDVAIVSQNAGECRIRVGEQVSVLKTRKGGVITLVDLQPEE
ncbi:glycosyl hydrolase family 95 catalytic domain-containing protein [Armatimonas rosea]|uniref:Alpha-L-fucosidase 2 n=1 Tax=Armatimonas rosea TaxID=685828 RepID=A0A7W9W5C9_ARMRO|nr:alpha-L-fucosidase 2 [Armatimonas rosea]